MDVSSYVSLEQPPATPAPPVKDKPKKQKCGAYKHVLLAKEEFDKLVEDYGLPRVKEAITYLDEYIEMKGYKAKNHNLAIRRWVFDALDERDQKRARNQRKGGKPFESSFDTDDFFAAALARSYAEAEAIDAEVKTAANDEGIRERADELRDRLGQA